MPGLKARLTRGETLIGPFVVLNDPDLVELIGRAGWDFAILDCEHGPFGVESVGNLARACEASGLHTVVRVPANEDWLVNKALDVGAEAVLVPQIDSIHAARRAVSAAKYAPQGSRGANPFTRASKFTARGGPDYYARANQETALMLLVEGVGGASAMAEMAALENVDALFIGPVDLSHSLGVPGQPDHPSVIAKIKEMAATARECGKAVGVFANDVHRARGWMDLGIQFIAYGVDTGIAFSAFQNLAAELKGSNVALQKPAGEPGARATGAHEGERRQLFQTIRLPES